MRPYIFPAFITLLLIAFPIGLLMTLFGPAVGKFVSAITFALLWISGVVVMVIRRTHRPLVEVRPSLSRCRRPIIATGIVCFFTMLLSMAVQVFGSQGGVADNDDQPVFAERPIYELRNHGVTWQVTRTRYLVVATAFLLAWHALPTLVSLVILYHLLYGIRP